MNQDPEFSKVLNRSDFKFVEYVINQLINRYDSTAKLDFQDLVKDYFYRLGLKITFSDNLSEYYNADTRISYSHCLFGYVELDRK